MSILSTDDLTKIPAVAELDRASQSLAIDARTFTVTTPEAYEFAGTKLTEIKARRKALDELRKTITEPLDKAKKAVMDFFRGPGDRLDQAEAAIKRSMLQFQAEAERKRREEQARLEEQARKEREKLERQAAAAAAKGREEKAAELEARAATVVAPIAQTAARKVAGVGFRTVWKFEVVDPAAVPREYLVVDEAKIRKVVGALKEGTSIPGVRVWSEKSIAAGAA